ncbi:MAG: hypothetical protein WCR95_06010 [Eubacteriales bacterium]
MDGGLGDKIREILNDPEAMGKIMQIASGLAPSKEGQGENMQPGGQPGGHAGGQGGGEKPVSALGSLAQTISPLGALGGGMTGDRRIALLSSLRPLLKEEKRQKLDNIKTAFTIANLLGNYKKRT